jgi:hypothetical protein
MAIGYELVSRPLLASALVALAREAEDNADAARLLATIEEMQGPCCHWCWLEALNHFDCDGPIRARPVLLSVLLKELSAVNPVPLSLLQ